MNEKAIYQQVADEIASGQLDRALWTRAFAEANGVDAAARAHYIKARVAELKASQRAMDRATRRAERPAIKERLRQYWPWLVLVACAVALAGLQMAIKAGAFQSARPYNSEYVALYIEGQRRYVFTAIDGKRYSIDSPVARSDAELRQAIAELNASLVAKGVPSGVAEPVKYENWFTAVCMFVGLSLGLLLIPAALARFFRGQWRFHTAWIALALVGGFSTYAIIVEHCGAEAGSTFKNWAVGIAVLSAVGLIIILAPRDGSNRRYGSNQDSRGGYDGYPPY